MARMLRSRFAPYVGMIGIAALTSACSRQREPSDQGDQAVATAKLPVFLNGDFEAGTNNSPPPDWTVTTYLNDGIIYIPQNRSQLQLQTGGNALTVTRTSAGPESSSDPDLGTGATFRYPKFGQKVAVVNRRGESRNVNSMKQSMTIGVADVDPLDGKAHVRFTIAPVLEYPTSHADSEQPYYWVQLNNTTRNTTLYQDFNRSAQPGVPWKISNGIYYTDWQLVDIAPGGTALALGDTVELEIIAAGCSRGGHWGEVYVDGVGSTLASLFATATGPSAQNAGSDITYTLTYKNGSATAAAGVKLDFNTPPNTTWVGYNAPGITCTTPTGTGGTGLSTCTIGNVAPGSGGTLKITVKINPSATGTITNGNYSIYGTGISPTLGPKVYTTITSGVTYADLAVSMTNGTAGVAWGTSTSYTIVVRNNGPSAITGATVQDAIPAQLTGATWTCVGAGGGTCPASGTGSINTTVNLPVNATATFTLKANVVAGSGSGTVTNTATVTLPNGSSDPDATNSTATDTDSIGELRTITVSKTGDGVGSIVSSPAAIDCGANCTSATGSFLQGTTVVLNAVAVSGDTFTGWTGTLCTGTSPTCTINTLSANGTAIANFAPTPKPNGTACAVSAGCSSGNCIDGVCCNTPCGDGVSSDCQACNLASNVGTCTALASGAVCRASVDVCDPAETCNGTSTSCPTNAFEPATKECRAKNGDCDRAEFCTGTGAACPADLVANASTVCRVGTGDCDLAENCDGTTKNCPADAVVSASTPCRPITGVCDLAELCDGSSKGCPDDVFAPLETQCRTASCSDGTAILAANCTGASAACPVVSSVSCGNLICGTNACLTTCLTNDNCVTGNYCAENGTCAPKLASGGACTRNDMCQTGFCVDGVCCDSACSDQCEACDVAEHVGTCSATTGAPHGARAACATDGSVCGGSCNGQLRTACAFPDPNTACRAPSCSNGVATLAANCNGAGLCGPQQTQPCPPFQCGGTQCLGNCSLDAQCAEGNYCSAGVCVPKLTLGTTCATDSQCASGNCVDGVCCNKSCTGQCEACNVQDALGNCTPITGAPRSPRPACASDGSACGGYCDGTDRAACHYPADERICRPESCTAALATIEARCDGEGSCPAIKTQDCTPFTCGPTGCAGNCTIDADCVTGNFCSAGICVLKLAQGAKCNADSECSTNHCVDGVCCDGACTGQCEACDAAGRLGFCSVIAGAPHSARTPCNSDGSLCGGQCNGTKRDACTYPGVAVNCRAASCTNGIATLAANCNGDGACPGLDQQSCGAFQCGPSSCQGNCSADSNCGTGEFCRAGICTSKRTLGQACTASTQCASTYCVDGVCCNAACRGQCQACDVTLSLGTCTAVTGMPHGSRAACSGSGNCVGECDGEHSEVCAYPDEKTTCAEGSCFNGVAHDPAVCDGKGSCGASPQKSCGAFQCSGTACATSCTSNLECATGKVCLDGTCKTSAPGTGGAAGSAGTTAVAGSGTTPLATGGTAPIGGDGGAPTGGTSTRTSTSKLPWVGSNLEGGGCSCRTTQGTGFGRAVLGSLVAALAVSITRRRRAVKRVA